MSQTVVSKRVYTDADFQLKEISVDMPGGKQYVLRQPKGSAVTQWKNAQAKAARMTNGKVTGVDGIASTEPLLVSLCLFELYQVNGETKERPVPINVIANWPSQIQSDLFDDAIRLGNLAPRRTPAKVREEIKNLQGELDELLQQEAEGDPLKNSQENSADGSQ